MRKDGSKTKRSKQKQNKYRPTTKSNQTTTTMNHQPHQRTNQGTTTTTNNRLSLARITLQLEILVAFRTAKLENLIDQKEKQIRNERGGMTGKNVELSRTQTKSPQTLLSFLTNMMP